MKNVPLFSLLVFLLGFNGLVVFAQKISSHERSQSKDILKSIKSEIKDNYFDPNFKGVNLDEVFKAAEAKLDGATTLGQAFGIIAQAVLELDDSHTTFYPPERTLRVDYGWQMQMIGDKCMVIAVRPGSDAEKKGLKIGDQVMAIEGFTPTRKELWKVNYYYNVISPRAGMVLKLKGPASDELREVSVASKMVRTKQTTDFAELIREIQFSFDSNVENRFVKVGNTTAWKMPTFSIDPGVVDGIMSGRISQSGNLILDLRGNGGGYVVTLESLAGFFVESDTKIADHKARKPIKPLQAKSKGNSVYTGKIVVLVDSRSGSASELFARFIQLNKRGVVFGDTSAGAVMMSRGWPMQLGGGDYRVTYGMNMTQSDVIMTDGKSLEHVGVIPDLTILPSGSDMSSGKDPALAAAFKYLGENVSTEQAGKYFPFEWK